MRSRDEGLVKNVSTLYSASRSAEKTHEGGGINNTQANGALDSQVRVQDRAHGSGTTGVVDSLNTGTSVRLDFSVGLRVGEVAVLGDDPVLPGGGSGEATDGLDGLTHGLDVELGVEEADIDDGGVEGVGGLDRDGATCRNKCLCKYTVCVNDWDRLTGSGGDYDGEEGEIVTARGEGTGEAKVRILK